MSLNIFRCGVRLFKRALLSVSGVERTVRMHERPAGVSDKCTMEYYAAICGTKFTGVMSYAVFPEYPTVCFIDSLSVSLDSPADLRTRLLDVVSSYATVLVDAAAAPALVANPAFRLVGETVFMHVKNELPSEEVMHLCQLYRERVSSLMPLPNL